MDVVASSVFGIQANVIHDKDSMFYRMGERIQNQFRGINLLKFLLLIMFPKLNEWAGINVVDKQVSKFFGNVIQKTVKQRVASGEIRDDFVQLMLETRKTEIITSRTSTDEDRGISEPNEKDAEMKNSKTSKVYLTDELMLAQSML